MIYTPQLNPFWRDNWGEYMPLAMEAMKPLQDSGLYECRYYHAPNNQTESLAANATNNYSLYIPVGSFIWGILHDATATPANAPFTVQISDTRSNYDFFSTPVPNTLIAKNGYMANLLHEPYPVANPGIFQVRFWNGPTAQICSITLGVAVPKGTQ